MNTYKTFYHLLFIKKDDDESPILDQWNILQIFVHNIKNLLFTWRIDLQMTQQNDKLGIILGSYEG